MKRLSFLIAFASLMLFLFGLAHAATEITLDNMTGIYAGDSVIAGASVRWNLRLTYTPGDGSAISGSTNGFEVYTHLGGDYTDNFTAITYDTFPWSWPDLYDLTGGLVLSDFSVDGVGADTVGFGGAKLFDPGIVDGTDALCWWIETTPNTDSDTLCIDSAYYPPAGEWFWSTKGPLGNFVPDWGGPYCFHVHDTTTPVNNPPVLDSIGPQSTTENVQLTFDVSASDVESIPTLTTSTLPGGANFMDNGDGTGEFDWTPGYTESGTYFVTFYATDDYLAIDSEVIQIDVAEAGNQAPVLASIGPQSTMENEQLIFGVSATDAESIPTLTVSNNLPAGAVFVDSGNGAGSFDWTPGYTDAGTYFVTFYATDDSAAVDSEEVTITVDECFNLVVSPDTLHFTAVEGGTSLDPDSFTVSEIGNSAIAFDLVETSGWFDLDKTGGTTPEDVEVSVDISGLSDGTYFDSVTVSSSKADNSLIYEFISLIIVDTTAHTFTVDSIAVDSGVQEVVVPVEFVNLHDLEYIWVRLDWVSDYLMLDSVSFADSRLDFFPIKWDSIRNDLNFVQLKCYDSVVAPGAGNFVNLHFSVAAGTPPGFYDIVRWICTVPPCPIYNPYFIVRPGPDEILYLEPHFTPGGIEVVPPANYLAIDPDTLYFFADSGGANPDTQSFNVSEIGDGAIAFDLSETSSWFDLDKTGGTTPEDVVVTVDISGLGVNTYLDSVTVSSGEAANTPQYVYISLEVAPAPILEVTPDTLYFFADSGGANPDTQSFNVSETGGGAIAFDLSETSSWFDLDKTGGTTPEDVVVSVDISGLIANTYFDSVTVSSGEADNSPLFVFVSLEVTQAFKFLEVEPESLYVTAIEGGALTDTSFIVTETGGAAIAYTVSEASIWFDLDRSGGTTPDTVGVSFNISSLTAGDYFDSVTVISGEADNSPVYQFISLIIVDTMAHTFTVDSIAANPGGQVVVPVEFVNLYDLEYIWVGLDWDSDYLTLDSVSFVDSRLDFFPFKLDSIFNDLNLVKIRCQDGVVAPGAGNFVNLHFSLDAGTPTGFYDIVRWICTVPPCPIYNPYFIVRPGPDEILYLEPHFTPGGIAVYDVCGYVVDPDSLSIPDATVELWDFFPDGLLEDSDTTDVNGLFGFSDVGLPQFDLWAYHEGYYPRLVEDVPFGETGIMIVLTPASGTIAVKGVDLPGDTTGAPKDTVRFRVGVRNDGDSLDIYKVTSKSARDWQTINQDTFMYTDVSETVYVYFDVIIPTWPGDIPDTITFSVFSYLDTSKHVDGNVELIASLTDVGDEPFAELPGGFYLHQNYPNPFNPTTTISFTLSSRSNVRLEIFDLLGRQVDIRDLGRLPSGDHSLEYDASGLPSGVYFYRLVTETSSWTRKMILLK